MQLVTSHHMERIHWKDAPTYILQCREMEILISEGDMDKQLETQELIRKHCKVFQELSMSLPTNRKTKHIIEIEPGTKPANNNPYKYLHQRRCDSSCSHCRQIIFEDKASLRERQCNKIQI